jgi:hypothetical protein
MILATLLCTLSGTAIGTHYRVGGLLMASLALIVLGIAGMLIYGSGTISILDTILCMVFLQIGYFLSGLIELKPKSC